MPTPPPDTQHPLAPLDRFTIELPSWGFADTGTRFGKFFQDAAASTLDEKLHDAGLVHRLTGCCPRVAVHVLWDFDTHLPPPQAATAAVSSAESHGIQIGSINPNLFQDQRYKLGSFCSPDPKAREAAVEHTLYCVDLMAATGSRTLSLWLADGTNYPGQDNLYRRKHRLVEGLQTVADAMRERVDGGRMLIEYKPFEPGFYHTDLADWGMAAGVAASIGGMQHHDVKVLVDTGHHLPGCNIEHLVAFMLDEDLLGGFHFNDRKYADDDITLGSIDPYQVFRIFDQIAQYEHDTGQPAAIEYMIDQSHNLKPKIEAMVQTVIEAQKQYLRAHLVDRDALASAQHRGDIVAAEQCLKRAFELDVTDLLTRWRTARGLAPDPLTHLRESGEIERLGKERAAARGERGEVRGGSYA